MSVTENNCPTSPSAKPDLLFPSLTPEKAASTAGSASLFPPSQQQTPAWARPKPQCSGGLTLLDARCNIRCWCSMSKAYSQCTCTSRLTHPLFVPFKRVREEKLRQQKQQQEERSRQTLERSLAAVKKTVSAVTHRNTAPQQPTSEELGVLEHQALGEECYQGPPQLAGACTHTHV